MPSDLRVPRIVLGAALVYLAAHLAFLAPSLEDIDSINFALGLRHFDVANHQPHPPGYPVYIALGHISSTLMHWVAPALDPARLAALALAIWSALGGALALIAAFVVFDEVDRASMVQGSQRAESYSSRAVWGTAILAAAPLFWIAGSRPMSDMPGLAIALLAQALALRGRTDRKALIAGAFIAGLAAGLRIQTTLLTLPLIAVALYRQRVARTWWLLSRPVLALVIGVLVWAVPLLMLSGSDTYAGALGDQAGEDFAWTGMLYENPTLRRLLFALWDTFVQPWESIQLGIAVGVLALAGALAALVRSRHALVLMAIGFVPYAVFHLLFQETAHVRYAMPVLPVMAWLVVCATSISGRAFPVLSGLVVAVALFYAVPTGIAYGRQAHPAFRAISEMQTAAATHRPAAVYSHFSLRRPLQAADPNQFKVIEPKRTYEWLGLADYWQAGGKDPVWFLADARRTDLALIDPQSRRNVTHFDWAVADRPQLSGTRPGAVDWYRFGVPGWFAREGWGLTPETGGIAQATGNGVDRRPIVAYVRRRPGPFHLVVGTRHFGMAGDPAATLTLSIDEMPVDTWTMAPVPGGSSALRFVDLPDGLPAGHDEYARVTITSRPESGESRAPQVAIRQFDIQPANTLIYGFGEGWHEAEYDNATGLRWRWTSGRSVIRVSPPIDVEVHMRGESPLKYFAARPKIRISAGGRVVGELQPGADFEWRVRVPADAVRSADGAITIETDQIYRPGEAEGTADPRQLGLRLFEIDVNQVMH